MEADIQCEGSEYIHRAQALQDGGYLLSKGSPEQR